MAIRTTGTGRAAGVAEASANAGEGVTAGPDLLPEPGAPISPAMLATLVLEASKSSRQAYRAMERSKSTERAADQAEEVQKMHDEADNALVGGIVSGSMQAASGAMKLAGTMDTNRGNALLQNAKDAKDAKDIDAGTSLNNAGAKWGAASDFTNAGNGFAQGLNQASGKDLEADAKEAQNKAETAKDEHDAAADGLRAQQDLEQAFLQAYSALMGSQSQVWQATMGSRV